MPSACHWTPMVKTRPGASFPLKPGPSARPARRRRPMPSVRLARRPPVAPWLQCRVRWSASVRRAYRAAELQRLILDCAALPVIQEPVGAELGLVELVPCERDRRHDQRPRTREKASAGSPVVRAMQDGGARGQDARHAPEVGATTARGSLTPAAKRREACRSPTRGRMGRQSAQDTSRARRRRPTPQWPQPLRPAPPPARDSRRRAASGLSFRQSPWG
jgi:hypothetical protein